MTPALSLLRSERHARWFFVALAQSALGTGAGYVALLVVAYDRLHSPWAISLVLLADFAPAMVLGPLLGAAADRWSRRRCAVLADAVRAVAFVGVALAGSLAATVAFALVAGVGTALFRPATMAALPSLVREERSAAATSLYGATSQAGFVAGPALAALALLAVGPEELLLANGATFAISAAILARLRFGAPVADAARPAAGRSLLAEAREGLAALAGMPLLRLIVAASAIGALLGAVYNVVELPFATDELGSGTAGYAALAAAYGLGFVGGSLRGSGGDALSLKRGFVRGLALLGAGGLAIGVSPAIGPAVAAFAVAGCGNGLAVVHERLLLQSEVAPRLHGRAFAAVEWLAAWGFVAGFLLAGVLTALTDPRELMLLNAGAEIALAAVAAMALLRPRAAGYEASAFAVATPAIETPYGE
ncbi:MAG TPA: MFS transporter [Thermoleophilaceae bacterium]